MLLLRLYWVQLEHLPHIQCGRFLLASIKSHVDTATQKEKSIKVHNVVCLILNCIALYLDLRLGKRLRQFHQSALE